MEDGFERRMRRWSSRVGGAAAVGLVLAFTAGPFLWILSTSLKSPELVGARPPTWVPDFDPASYRTVLSRQDFPRFFLNSTIVATITTLIAITLGSAAAYALARLRLRWRGWLLALFLGASMFPQIAIAGGIYRILLRGGLLNTYPGLILPYTALTLPLAVWILAGFFREIPRDLEDAARIDGCGPWTTLTRVFLPVAAPAVFTAAILIFIYAWNEFFFALLIMTNPAVQTLPVGIAQFPGAHEVPWGDLAAAAVIATAPLVVLVLALQRRIIRGLMAGALKG